MFLINRQHERAKVMTISRIFHTEIWRRGHNQSVNFPTSRTPRRGDYLPIVAKKVPKQKSLLAMTINSDRNHGSGVSPGSTRRNYEGVGNPSFYLYFERVVRPALRGDGLPVQRNAGERSVYSRSPSAERRHDHAAARNVHLDDRRDYHEGHYVTRADND